MIRFLVLKVFRWERNDLLIAFGKWAEAEGCGVFENVISQCDSYAGKQIGIFDCFHLNGALSNLLEVSLYGVNGLLINRASVLNCCSILCDFSCNVLFIDR